MIVYPDLAFFLALVFWGCAVRLSLRFLELSRPRWQITLTVLTLALCAALWVIPSVPAILPAMGGILPPAVLFRGKTLWGTVRNLISFWGIFFPYLGGFLLLSLAFSAGEMIFLDSGGYFSGSFGGTAAAELISYAVLWKILQIRQKRRGQGRLCDCLMIVEGVRIPFRAYLDTGNFLTDPISGVPVAVVEYDLLRRAFGPAFPRPMTYEFSARFSQRAKIIPCRSVSGAGEMLSGFVPDFFSVESIATDTVVAVTEGRLERRGRFSGIIGPGSWKGES